MQLASGCQKMLKHPPSGRLLAFLLAGCWLVVGPPSTATAFGGSFSLFCTLLFFHLFFKVFVNPLGHPFGSTFAQMHTSKSTIFNVPLRASPSLRVSACFSSGAVIEPSHFWGPVGVLLGTSWASFRALFRSLFGARCLSRLMPSSLSLLGGSKWQHEASWAFLESLLGSPEAPRLVKYKVFVRFQWSAKAAM